MHYEQPAREEAGAAPRSHRVGEGRTQALPTMELEAGWLAGGAWASAAGGDARSGRATCCNLQLAARTAQAQKITIRTSTCSSAWPFGSDCPRATACFGPVRTNECKHNGFAVPLKTRFAAGLRCPSDRIASAKVARQDATGRHRDSTATASHAAT